MMGFLKESSCNVGDMVPSLGWEDPLEEGSPVGYSLRVRRVDCDSDLTATVKEFSDI